MKTPRPKLPAFTGRCHVQFLRGAAAHAADTAAHLQRFRELGAALRPEKARSRSADNWLLGLLLLLLVAALSHRAPARAAARATAAEYAPLAGRHEWRLADTLAD